MIKLKYSKTCLKQPLSKRPKIGFQDQLSLNAGQKYCRTVIFLPARPASQTHDSHKGRMILNHVNPAGRIKNCGEKSAFKNLQLSF